MLSACVMMAMASGVADAQTSARLSKAPVAKATRTVAKAPAVSVEPAEILVTVVDTAGEPVSDQQAAAFLKGKPSVVIIRHPRADTRGVNKEYALKRGTEARAPMPEPLVNCGLEDFQDHARVRMEAVREELKRGRRVSAADVSFVSSIEEAAKSRSQCQVSGSFAGNVQELNICAGAPCVSQCIPR